MEKVFLFKVNDILGILTAAASVYVLLIIFIRILGKRSISQLNTFDWIVTVSIGSIFASTIILKNISLFEGAIAILFLFILQFITTKTIKTSTFFRKRIKASPRLLLYKGEFIEESLKKERILKEEIYAEVRQKGLKSIKQVYAIVLETNSNISVIADEHTDFVTCSLKYVKGLPKDLKDKL